VEPEVKTIAASCWFAIPRDPPWRLRLANPRAALKFREMKPGADRSYSLARPVRQNHVRSELRELPDHFRRMGRWQQTHAFGHETGGKAQGEQIAVGADIQHMFAGRETGRKPAPHRLENCRAGDGLAPAVGDDRGTVIHAPTAGSCSRPHEMLRQAPDGWLRDRRATVASRPVRFTSGRTRPPYLVFGDEHGAHPAAERKKLIRERPDSQRRPTQTTGIEHRRDREKEYGPRRAVYLGGV